MIDLLKKSPLLSFLAAFVLSLLFLASFLLSGGGQMWYTYLVPLLIVLLLSVLVLLWDNLISLLMERNNLLMIAYIFFVFTLAPFSTEILPLVAALVMWYALFNVMVLVSNVNLGNMYPFAIIFCSVTVALLQPYMFAVVLFFIYVTIRLCCHSIKSVVSMLAGMLLPLFFYAFGLWFLGMDIVPEVERMYAIVCNFSFQALPSRPSIMVYSFILSIVVLASYFKLSRRQSVGADLAKYYSFMLLLTVILVITMMFYPSKVSQIVPMLALPVSVLVVFNYTGQERCSAHTMLFALLLLGTVAFIDFLNLF